MPRLRKHKGDTHRPRARINKPPEGILEHPVNRYLWQCCRSRITFTAHTVQRMAALFKQSIEIDEICRCIRLAQEQRWCHVVQDLGATERNVYVGDA